jgi:hypothetical protein
VFSGSVGITGVSGKVTVEQNTSVDDPGSIVIAPNIDIKNGASVANPVYGVASYTYPAFEGNISYSSSSDLTVADNATVTLPATDTLRRNITVGKNATLIFNGSKMNVTNNFTLKNGATLKFTQCTKVRVKNDFNADDNATINAAAYGVMFHVNHNASFGKGSEVTATVYAPNGNIHVEKASAATPNIMTGKFIAKDINGDDYTYWYENTDCPCSTGSGSPLARTIAPAPATAEPAKAAPADGSAFMIKTYPNPFSNEVHLRVYTLDTETPVSLKIFDASGQILEVKENISYELGDMLIGKSLPAGMYLIQVTQGKNMQVERVVKVE